MTRCPVSAPLVLLLAAAAAGCGNPLMAKEDRERIEVVKQAVEREPSRINAADEHGWPPLHNAVINGYTDLLNWLLDRGADPNVAGPGGRLRCTSPRSTIRRGTAPSSRRSFAAVQT